MPSPSRDEFVAFVRRERASGDPRTLAVPVSTRLLDDALTPVLAYRRLVLPDERTDPSFLLESVEGGERQGRHSILGAAPRLEVVAHGTDLAVRDRRGTPGGPGAGVHERRRCADPLGELRRIASGYRLARAPAARGLEPPACVLGGWFGYAAYDAVRYAEPEKLAHPPADDRRLPDVSFAFYDGVVVFDHVDKLVHVVHLALVGPNDDPGEAYARAEEELSKREAALLSGGSRLRGGRVRGPAGVPATLASNLTRAQHAAMVARALEYIRAGDIFQVVVGQRFEAVSPADPFDVYRALRAVNPSPYMVYLQGPGCVLVAASPEILCRVRRAGDGRLVVTNRPLAGTRRRGATPEEDAALERELLGDPKERAEHIMLVDLGRNDVGQVAVPGTVSLDAVMSVERYSHVMHISSTVTGVLRDGLDAWDALRAALPVGTISGAPKIRAMQIIDELEPVRRGPYGGGMGYVGLDGQMDIALALRTIVVPTERRTPDGRWTYHLQAAGGIVADSSADDEYMETVNKAAAMARAIELAERSLT